MAHAAPPDARAARERLERLLVRARETAGARASPDAALRRFRNRHAEAGAMPPAWRGKEHQPTAARAHAAKARAVPAANKRKRRVAAAHSEADDPESNDESDGDDDAPAAAPTHNNTRGGREVDASVWAERLEVTDVKLNDWVCVNSGDPRKPWHGRVIGTDPATNTLCVRWLEMMDGRPSPVGRKPLFKYEGGSHFVGIDTVDEVSRELFHASGPLARARVDANASASERKTKYYCLTSACRGCHAPEPDADDVGVAKETETKPEDIIEWQTNVSAIGVRPSDRGFTYSSERILRGAARLSLLKTGAKGTLAQRKGVGLGESAAGEGGQYDIEPRVAKTKCMCRGIARNICPVVKEGAAARKAKRSGKGASAAGSSAELQRQCPTWQVHTGALPRPLQVRPTGSRGYGVFAMEDIPKGAFIVEYIGELLGTDLARKREKHYTHFGLFYLHDVPAGLHAAPGETMTIDPTLYGNVGRMFNHCCEPNMTTLEIAPANEVATQPAPAAGTLVSSIPRVGFFAKCDIPKGTECTLDYCPGRKVHEMRKVERCACGSDRCRGWVW